MKLHCSNFLSTQVRRVDLFGDLPLTPTLNFGTDLRPLFHWNTKQVFLYLTAEYQNRNGVSCHFFFPDSRACLTLDDYQMLNEVVIWDRIVRRRQDARIRIQNAQNKYHFKEFSKSFRLVFFLSLVARLAWFI